jgi:hypothetical protein
VGGRTWFGIRLGPVTCGRVAVGAEVEPITGATGDAPLPSTTPDSVPPRN